MARAGMSNLIGRLRRMADAGTAEWAKDGTNYYADDHLQTVLDEHRVFVIGEHLQVRQESWAAGGTAEYHHYLSRYKNFEEASSGTDAFAIRTSAGTLASGYTANYVDGHIYWGANQAGTDWQLSGRSYNLRGAAADIWRERAANVHSLYTYSLDSQKLSRSEIFDHCIRMAESFDKQEGITVSLFERSDLA